MLSVHNFRQVRTYVNSHPTFGVFSIDPGLILFQLLCYMILSLEDLCQSAKPWLLLITLGVGDLCDRVILSLPDCKYKHSVFLYHSNTGRVSTFNFVPL